MDAPDDNEASPVLSEKKLDWLEGVPSPLSSSPLFPLLVFLACCGLLLLALLPPVEFLLLLVLPPRTSFLDLLFGSYRAKQDAAESKVGAFERGPDSSFLGSRVD